MQSACGSKCWVAAHLLLLSMTSFAAGPLNITNAEIAMIPTYCRDTQSVAGYGDAYSPSPRAPHWVELMGKGFWHMHHYCWSLIELARAEKHSLRDAQRRNLRESALGGIDYAITNGIKDSGPKFVMLPELLVKRAEVLLLLRADNEALASFQKAIEVKEDYWPAYAGLAEYHMSRSATEKAREFVERGLKFSPNSKSLNSLLEELNAPPGKKKMPK